MEQGITRAEVATRKEGESTEKQSFSQSATTITLPKGGGAIRGMGEKFAANPVTGTGSMSVPIATSPGRSGFGPQLSLSYDSGAGNGPFGFGWSLSLPAITRKTDKGLPQYQDANESDVFVLSGAEDLVPVLIDKGGGKWEREHIPPRTVKGKTYHIQRYRPRIEGLFARIERWTNVTADGDVHWRSFSKDNILTIYGKDANSRISDPGDPTRIFSWLICETRDDKGNAILHEYKAENGVGVNLSHAHERNRGASDDKKRQVNRYLKYIKYGNRETALDNNGKRPVFLTNTQLNWMFEVVFDYGEHKTDAPKSDDADQWAFRDDPFSTYRAGFETRTTRLCQRVLMFHHFPDEEGVGKDCLVRSTDFTYSHEQDRDHVRHPVFTFLQQITQLGYKREGSGYLKRSMPPVEFEYTQPIVQDTVEEVDPASLENLPIGVEGMAYQWTDLHGEGLPGILTEQAGAWFYKRNLSPLTKKLKHGESHPKAKFAPLEQVALRPNLALADGAQFTDLAGDGQSDLVTLDGPMPGLYEHDGEEGWQPFRPFTARLNRDMSDPNLKFIDLDGDGHADVLITEDNAFIWHASLAEEGFGSARRVVQALDEEKGPRLVFADGTQSIHLADLSGDGLTDLVRIRNGEVCYWPNLGYARFGAKVTMDHAPHFDHPDQFDHKRLRLADIDGSGTTDLIYLHGDGVHLYFNQSGNSWSEPEALRVFPRVDDLVSIMPIDLLGNGTACLVWSSALPGNAARPMRYVNLMGGQKPHLLVKTVNNLGAETHVHYLPSTYFYLKDKRAGKPWITRLPFPVHVVERVETYDHISRNHFATRYAYHHGYFDGEEREFRGFGMVEQWDTEAFAALTAEGALSEATNLDAASHVPPVHTKTWFHTGVYADRAHISRQFEKEYYPGLTDDEFRAQLLLDTTLPDGLTLEEEREACRALKGMMLRQEVYADDAGPDASEAMIQRARTPYTVVEQDFTIRGLQPRAENRYGVFFTHPREAITSHYERNPTDPRTQHALTLEVDAFGNVLKEAAIGYGRLQSDANLPTDADRAKQTQTLITYTENRFTRSHDTGTEAIDTEDDYRTPLPAETRTYELTGYVPTGPAGRFRAPDFVQPDPNDDKRLIHVTDGEIQYEQQPTNGKQHRLIEHVRTIYRRNELTGSLPLGQVESLALPFESYQLALTPELAQQIYVDSGKLTLAELNDILTQQGRYVHSENDTNGWIPSGRMFYSPGPDDTPTEELAYARRHFFLPHRYRDPFHTERVKTETFVTYDAYDLLLVETRDALNNVVTIATEDDAGNAAIRIDYRVLQPYWVTDPNGNRTGVTFDALGMVVGTAVMGKPGEKLGDSLDGFASDLMPVRIDEFYQAADPHDLAEPLLKAATTRIIYDPNRFQHTQQAHPDNPSQWQPAYAATLTRETHANEPPSAGGLKMQISFSHSDGFGREIQKKIQAEPGPVPERDADGKIIVGANGQPVMTPDSVSPRWVGSGWTIFNNKGKLVRQYEPFFTDTHRFEFDVRIGVSPVLFYDPVERVVATLHPNHTYEKVVFDSWQQATFDVNDTVTLTPSADDDVKAFFLNPDGTLRIPSSEYLPTWHELRTKPVHVVEFAARYPDASDRSNETSAAAKAAAHVDTPTIAHFDTLGRPFLTIADNGVAPDGTPQHYATRVELDIEGNQRAVTDALARTVMRYDYDLLSNVIHQQSMEAGERWMLNNVAGNPIRRWDSRDHTFRTSYDVLQRPTHVFVQRPGGIEVLVERLVYGETHPDADRNLRGQPYQHYDPAGAVTNERFDFKGNLKEGCRQLAKEYKRTVDWSLLAGLTDLQAIANAAGPELEPGDGFTSHTQFDALNRPVTLTMPDKSIIRPSYNEANLLEGIRANLRGTATATPFVTNIDYDAKGQRKRIEYGNRIISEYDYDPETFRLIHLKTTRPATFLDKRIVQDLKYSYDPAGNITHIQDDADIQNTIYFQNQRVEPSADYEYDPLYRLIQATGREHLGQTGGHLNPPSQSDHDDSFRMNLPHPHDGKTMGNYTEHYQYDAVGNIIKMIHGTASGRWIRGYAYEEPSLIEPGKVNNRLSSTSLPSDDPLGPYSALYEYDVHGNMTRMPHLPLMQWDYQDQLHATSKQVVNNGGIPEITYYVYDTAGQRVRKVTERQAAAGEIPTRKAERIYLGGFELYREYQGDGTTPKLERETLHVMDDKQRIALVETKIRENSATLVSPKPLTRHQLGNHLGSAVLELDEGGEVISYEEYYPFGGTSYQAVRSGMEVSPKRYRYSGKERDEESGLYYHGARYYAPWLGRWTAADPLGLIDGPNVFSYVSNQPILMLDLWGTNGQTVDWDAERSTHTARKAREMNKALEEVKADDKKKTDPMQERAENYKKNVSRSGRTPIEQHHHADIKQAKAVSAKPDAVGKTSRMSSVWSRKSDPMVQGGIGDHPLWDPAFDPKKDSRTHHNVAKHLDKAEQAGGLSARTIYPRTAKGLGDASDLSKWRLPATADMTERAAEDWTKTTPAGPPVDPTTGKVVAGPKTDAVNRRHAGSVLTRLAKEVGPVAAKAAGRFVPVAGIAVSGASASVELAKGNLRKAALEVVAASEVPVVSQVADTGLMVEEVGWAVKDVLDPNQEAEGWYYRNVQARLDSWF